MGFDSAAYPFALCPNWVKRLRWHTHGEDHNVFVDVKRNPHLRCRRAQRDDTLVVEVERVWQANKRVYGTDKVWKQMNREGIAIARCTVERLMKRLGLQGVRRGTVVRTTVSDMKTPCPLDRVNREFKAERPNQLWVSDFTYVSTWQSWLYVAFVIDVYARRIVGWRVSSSMHTQFVLDALEQALYARQWLNFFRNLSRAPLEAIKGLFVLRQTAPVRISSGHRSAPGQPFATIIKSFIKDDRYRRLNRLQAVLCDCVVDGAVTSLALRLEAIKLNTCDFHCL